MLKYDFFFGNFFFNNIQFFKNSTWEAPPASLHTFVYMRNRQQLWRLGSFTEQVSAGTVVSMADWSGIRHHR